MYSASGISEKIASKGGQAVRVRVTRIFNTRHVLGQGFAIFARAGVPC